MVESSARVAGLASARATQAKPTDSIEDNLMLFVSFRTGIRNAPVVKLGLSASQEILPEPCDNEIGQCAIRLCVPR
ncbi:MAG TPA: hypothetical protein VND90_05175 [Terracidiphilus sp.]|nr:hypothetical protein [Terracidiphilus sp.]